MWESNFHDSKTKPLEVTVLPHSHLSLIVELDRRVIEQSFFFREIVATRSFKTIKHKMDLEYRFRQIVSWIWFSYLFSVKKTRLNKSRRWMFLYCSSLQFSLYLFSRTKNIYFSSRVRYLHCALSKWLTKFLNLEPWLVEIIFFSL